MAKKLYQVLSTLLALVLCSSVVSTPAMAKTTLDNGNIWYGDEMAVEVTAGTEGYNYMSLFRKPSHAYEISNHFMASESPQTFVVIDTAAYNGTTWTPNGIYSPYTSNYDVTYCCDVETIIGDSIYYKRMNLEDSEYFNNENAAKIRSIVTNSYPYVSLEAMKADLAENGFTDADKLTRGDIIAAVQTAIWTCANGGETLRYNKTYNVPDNFQWGTVMHDYNNEMKNEDGTFDWATGNRKFTNLTEVGTRVDALVDYLLTQNAVYADKAQIIITDLKMTGAPVALNGEYYTTNLEITLNNSGSGYQDNIQITVTAGDNVEVVPVKLGTETYNIKVVAQPGDTIKAVVSGTQVLHKGVYFYAPKAADVNNDGIATSREVSQNLVGVAMGETPVYAEASIGFNNVTFRGGTVSNISYMFINKETGNVEFINKIDINDDATSTPILMADNYVSVMFMKQGTSGMFWFSEVVDATLVNAAIDCLIDNNPSYKGHNAIAFGNGSHKLEFKKNKCVTYTFG